MKREQEHDADQRGMLIMARAGYHPDFVFALHHLLLMRFGEQSKLRTFFFLDHPRWETRDQRSDRVYSDALAEFNRRWPDAATSPGGNPPVVAFLGKPQASENHQAGSAVLKIPMYCRNSVSPIAITVWLSKDNHPVQALDPAFAENGKFVLHRQGDCVDKDDAIPVTIELPSTAVSDHDRSVKAEVRIASGGAPIAVSKLFDVHFPKPTKESIARRDSENHDRREAVTIPDVSSTVAKTTPAAAALPSPSPSIASIPSPARIPTGRVVEPASAKSSPTPSPAPFTATAPGGDLTGATGGNTRSPSPASRLPAVSALKSASTKETPESAPIPLIQPRAGVLGISGANWEEDSFRGVEILGVDQDSPAEIAGLQVHEVITTVNGRRIRSTNELASVLAQNGPGSKITLVYISKSNLGWMSTEVLVILAHERTD